MIRIAATCEPPTEMAPSLRFDLPARPDRPALRRRIEDLAIVATPLVVGGLSGVATIDGVRTWYRTLDRPTWTPPDAVFGPVWTTLYAMMGVALRDLIRSGAPADRRRLGIGLFALQLTLNAGWSWIFFVRHDLAAALVEILALWAAIAATIVAFGRVRTRAAALLVPYLGWVTFATALTAAIWTANR